MFRTITPIISVVIAITVFFSFTKPMFGEVRDIDTEAAQYEKVLDDTKKLNARLSALVAEKRSHPIQTLERIEAFVPSDIDEVSILADLANMASRNSLLFGNVSLAGQEDGVAARSAGETAAISNQDVTYDSLTHTDISFEVIGTYDQVKIFLADIERSLVLMEVTDLKVTATENESPLQQFAFSVRVYALPALGSSDK